MMTLTLDIRDRATPAVTAFVAKLRTRRGMHQAIGHRVKSVVRDHVLRKSTTQHTTANKLGATPSGFIGQAVEAVERTQPQASEERVTITLPHPYYARAFHDVTIEPKSGRYLTIPLIAEAYNQRARRVEGLFFFRGERGLFLARSDKRGNIGKTEFWYLLVPSVHQAQDRERLPSDAALLRAALQGVRDYVELLIAARNN